LTTSRATDGIRAAATAAEQQARAGQQQPDRQSGAVPAASKRQKHSGDEGQTGQGLKHLRRHRSSQSPKLYGSKPSWWSSSTPPAMSGLIDLADGRIMSSGLQLDLVHKKTICTSFNADWTCLRCGDHLPYDKDDKLY
jgi:hypothetical protein